MADVAKQIPIIGPWLPVIGVGGPRYEPVDVTIRGKTQTVRPTIRGPKVVKLPRPGRSPTTPTSAIDPFGSTGVDLLAEYIRHEHPFLDDFSHVPVDPGPLPDPIMEPVPVPTPNPPYVNLPVDLPEIVVQPAPVSPPVAVPEPPPLEVPLERVIFNPATVPFPNAPGARPGPSPSTRSAPRSNVLAQLNPLAGLLLGLNPFAGVSSARAPNLARSPSPVPRSGAKPTPGTQPRVPSLPDLTDSPFTSVGNQPVLNLALGAQPSPQQQLDKCKCDEKKKKKREPRPPRTICYKGTYTQRSRGISYSRGKQVPCEGTSKGPGGAVSSLLGFAGMNSGEWSGTLRTLADKAAVLIRRNRKKATKAAAAAKKKAAAAERKRVAKIKRDTAREVKAIRRDAKKARAQLAKEKKQARKAAAETKKFLAREKAKEKKAAAAAKRKRVKAANAIKPVKIKLPKEKKHAANDNGRRSDRRRSGEQQSLLGLGF